MSDTEPTDENDETVTEADDDTEGNRVLRGQRDPEGEDRRLS